MISASTKKKKQHILFFPLFTMEQFAPHELCSIKLNQKRDKNFKRENDKNPKEVVDVN